MTEMKKRINSLELEIKITDCKEDQLRNEYYNKKASREVALVRRKKAEEQGLQADHIIVPPEPVFPSKELRKLRRHSTKQSMQLDKLRYILQQNGDPEKISLYPNYVELMISWGNTVMALWGLANIVGLSTFLAAGESWFIGMFGSALVFGAAWLPGILMSMVLPGVCERLGEVNSAYQDVRGVFGYGSKIGWKRFSNIDGTMNSVMTFATVFLAMATAICLTGGIFNTSALNLALVAGMILSWGGTIVVGIRLTYDAIRGKRKFRQVF